ncbi:flagellar hook protein FlgE [Clostridium sp. Marseille-P299]|uniref:flagellar hook protein FlgE n=1 Tax=Clostridium sp. Marseille-P299 TaxID=1805477 RepID=UPI00082D8D2C|nr:flagellar hook protein FlgE [Clostridium sp. Marseille-P299]
MMRSLYSGVSGLRVHQTKMDVIGNNISNVNTVGFKSSSVTFSDILYQTTKVASGPNVETGTAGTNATQIGLGSSLASITTNIGKVGGSQRTDNAFDVMIEGDGFFVVNNGNGNYFTRAGSFQVDAAGTLCTATGAKVMGWQVDKNNPNKTASDKVSELKVMSPENQISAPKATSDAYLTGNIDMNDTQLESDTGRPISMSFYDNLGNKYNASFKIVKDPAADTNSVFKIKLSDITNESGDSIFVNKVEAEDGTITYEASSITNFNFGLEDGENITVEVDEDTGEVDIDMEGFDIYFNGSTGEFLSVGEERTDTDTKLDALTFKVNSDPDRFSPIKMDFSKLTMFSNSGKSSVVANTGSIDGTGKGNAAGELSGISIDQAGKIYGVYDNGDNKLLGQIVVATFANPAGLEAVGNNMYAATQNSGEFDGIGQDVTSTGGSFETGVLEMSNVDLSSEFTEMITTQRGFQANSRIITTSDTLLEELINLKR